MRLIGGIDKVVKERLDAYTEREKLSARDRLLVKRLLRAKELSKRQPKAA